MHKEKSRKQKQQPKGRTKTQLKEKYKEQKKTLMNMIQRAKDKKCQQLNKDVWGDAYKIAGKKLKILSPLRMKMKR